MTEVQRIVTPAELSARAAMLERRMRGTKRDLSGLSDIDIASLSDTDAAIFEARVSKAEIEWKEFRDTWNEREELSVQLGASDTFPNDAWYQVYHALKEELVKANGALLLLKKREARSRMQDTTTLPACSTINNSGTCSLRPQLPKIAIPTFYGDMHKWSHFRDTFESLIHYETSLSQVEKFHYLIGALKGEAAAVISRFPVDEQSYELAWKRVVETYQNPRVLANSLVHRIIDFDVKQAKGELQRYECFLTGVADSIDAFRSLKLEDPADFLLTTLALRALDQETRRQFEMSLKSNKEFPTVDNVLDFVRHRKTAIRMSQDVEHSTRRAPAPYNRTTGKQNFVSLHATGDSSTSSGKSKQGNGKGRTGANNKQQNNAVVKCYLCQGDHFVSNCDTFRSLNLEGKLEQVRKLKLCRNCLRKGHMVTACLSRFCCRTCNKRHHTLVHASGATKEATSRDSAPVANADTFIGFGATPQASSSSESTTVLLGTVRALVRSPGGAYHSARAVLDSGSQHTFITSALARKIGAKVSPFSGNITSLGETAVPRSHLQGSASCTLRPCTEEHEYNISPVVVDRITSSLPTRDLPAAVINEIMRHPLADQQFGESASIDLLIGGDIFPRILTGVPYHTGVQGLYFTPTVFGLVVSGVLHDEAPSNAFSFLALSKNSLESQLKAFWELEEPASVDRSHPDDIQCEDHFVNTHSRTEEGRYVVRLPFKTQNQDLDCNRSVALRRFYVLESKFRKDPDLSSKYKAFMKEYSELGHMSSSLTNSSYLIPHHGIWQESPHGSKLRVVFDASCRSTRLSLNEALHAGPKLQRDICDILIRFRLYPIAVCADIVKMYRQIVMHQDDRTFQHVLWREEHSHAVQEFELNTVTYGVRSSAYQALRVIQQLVADEGYQFPLASSRVSHDMYVDDIVSGADTPEEGSELVSQLSALFAKGGFTLGKWASNIPDVLPHSSEQVQLVPIQHQENDGVKILGIFWNSTTDSFSYATLPPPSDLVTKRVMLSAVARIFDPLGLLSPVIFTAKHLIQCVWKAGLGWDDQLPAELRDTWKALTADWQILSSVIIPRYISNHQAIHHLVGFCDASSKGYAAALYLRSESPKGEIKVTLIKAKTKVAPVQFVSIARLELCGALLLSRLVSSAPKSIAREVICFTDSQVVLSWLHTPTYELGVFEANRVSQILQIVAVDCWRHISSEENPADLASRGCEPQKLLEASKWWNGPKWLGSPISQWFRPAERTVVMTSQRSAPQQDKPPYDWTERFSSFRTLIRTVARILRLVKGKKNGSLTTPPNQYTEQVTAEEIAEAELRCMAFIQRMYLPRELFKETANVPKPFAPLYPFLDERGIVRVGGRLQESSLPYAKKHPILLPRRAHLTNLIIDSIHSDHFHAGPALTLALLRGKYWIPTSGKLIRGRIQRCVHCRILRAKPITPLMAPLPRARIEETRAFNQVGVDYAGPFLIKESRRRNASLGKAYLCLFICMASKAVHLELVSSLTTSAFLASLARFTSRRGSPHTIWSDHGTNFIGASKFLKEVYKFQKGVQDSVSDTLAIKGIEWKFIPPRAPHFGGLWEAGIKSVKRLLTSSIGSQPLNFEELSTALIKVEALLNSRPLCPLNEDVTHFDYLTPGHFLIGGPLISLPQPSESLRQLPTLLSRWKVVEARVNYVWKRWSKEYLHTLQQRQKWTKMNPSLSVGDLVVLLERRTTVGQWPVARVTSTFPGRDGISRTLTVRTPSGNQLTRAVTSVVPLFCPSGDAVE